MVGRSWSVEGLQVRFVCVCVCALRVSGLWVALPLQDGRFNVLHVAQ